jgi:lipoyl(octanoyl) transferase
MQEPICEVHHLGILPYKPVWNLQERLAIEISAGKRHPTLLLLEHTHTYTFGRRGNPTNLIWDKTDINRLGIHVHWVDRGGDVTYHGPGQLVGYPLLPLDTSGLHSGSVHNSEKQVQVDYIGYLRKLEETLIRALDGWGVLAHSIPGLTGVWVQTQSKGTQRATPDQSRLFAKIASIGVKVDARGITRHGFALNVNPDMSYWQGIIPCGLDGYDVTSLEALIQRAPSMKTVREAIVASFGSIFSYDMQPAEDPVSV